MSIYLDNSATTKVRQEVIDAMLPYLGDKWGNPSSIHARGRTARKAIDLARIQVADLLNCKSEEVFFSSCGTMSNNVALLGRARFAAANDQGRHLITSQIEHPSILGPAKYLESQGWKVTYLPVDREGFISIDNLEKAITPVTSIISIMWANNEIGTVEPIKDFAEIARERNIYFHTDAVQVAGKIPIDLSDTVVSSLSLSGHKFYAPKGIGVLYSRAGENIMPIVFGGGQEMGLMPGTEALSNIVAIGKAAELARKELSDTRQKLIEISRKFVSVLTSNAKGIKICGAQDIDKRLPGHISITADGASSEALVLQADLKGICISNGSACHRGIIEPSSVLKALGLSDVEALSTVRIAAGKFNTLNECEQSVNLLCNIIATLQRNSSPEAAISKC
jgi:cysteine desulfurase